MISFLKHDRTASFYVFQRAELNWSGEYLPRKTEFRYHQWNNVWSHWSSCCVELLFRDRFNGFSVQMSIEKSN